MFLASSGSVGCSPDLVWGWLQAHGAQYVHSCTLIHLLLIECPTCGLVTQRLAWPPQVAEEPQQVGAGTQAMHKLCTENGGHEGLRGGVGPPCFQGELGDTWYLEASGCYRNNCCIFVFMARPWPSLIIPPLPMWKMQIRKYQESKPVVQEFLANSVTASSSQG